MKNETDIKKEINWLKRAIKSKDINSYTLKNDFKVSDKYKEEIRNLEQLLEEME